MVLLTIPRSCSSARVSVARASPALAAEMIPALERRESVKVDLPWSTWAITDMLRTRCAVCQQNVTCGGWAIIFQSAPLLTCRLSDSANVHHTQFLDKLSAQGDEEPEDQAPVRSICLYQQQPAKYQAVPLECQTATSRDSVGTVLTIARLVHELADLRDGKAIQVLAIMSPKSLSEF